MRTRSPGLISTTTALLGAVLVVLGATPAQAAPAQPAAAAEPTVQTPAPTPPMGWNSWNTFGCNIDEAKIEAAADAMVSSGMRDAGYDYIVVDDCWQSGQRDANGALTADPNRFPNGMEALGDYIHAKGLKFGIYQAPYWTCAQIYSGYPGGGVTQAVGHETIDAQTFAAWGVDYVKYDWCDSRGTAQEQLETFRVFGNALEATGRPIVYSINANSGHSNTGPDLNWGEVADLWRTTEDITDKWSSGCRTDQDCFLGVTEILDVQAGLTAWNVPGHYNDPDMLEVGVHGTFNGIENRAHFSMWAIMASPLMAGNDITTMSADVTSVLTNPEVIAVNQDPNAVQATRVRDDGDVEVWAKPLSDGSVAVALLNRGGASTRISTTAAQIGLSGSSSYQLRDLWNGGERATTSTISASVPDHGVALYRVTPGATSSTVVSLRSESAGKCLDMAGGVAGRGTGSALWTCEDSPAQRVTLDDGQLVVGGRCLDVQASDLRVIAWDCNGQANQQWQVRADGSIASQATGRCLDAPLSGGDNAPVGVWTCNGQANQRWSQVGQTAPTASSPPVISGTARPGNVLTATPGTWSEPQAPVAYQWLQGGQSIAGATSSTYTVEAGSEGSALAVQVSALGTSGLSGSSTSAPVTVLAPAAPVASAPPTVAGTPRVGYQLTATPGTWDQVGLTYAHQWLRDGQPIAGATTDRYVLQTADRGRSVSVRVTATGASGTTGTSVSTTSTVGSAVPPQAGDRPQITGTPDRGVLLTASAGTWDQPDLMTTYQWLRNGLAISRATAATYRVTAADDGQWLSVRVRVVNPVTGIAATATSDQVLAPAPVAPTSTEAPVISGTPTRGQTLTASNGTWDQPTVTYTYQWLRNGSRISGATSATYQVTPADEGRTLTVAVKATNQYNLSRTATSAGLAVAKPQPAVVTTAPVVSGSPVAGSRVEVTTGSWDRSPLTFTYQWLRNGSSIQGATGSSYVLGRADVGRTVTVRVTATTVEGLTSSTVVTLGRVSSAT